MAVIQSHPEKAEISVSGDKMGDNISELGFGGVISWIEHHDG
jgi:hypothetical protein